MRIQTLQANPKIADAVIKRDAELEALTKEFVESDERGEPIMTIPVVFHVIHKYGNENISREQVLDGLEVLNETFRKQIPDTADIHPDFKPLHADCEIEFKLATKDPEGNCHSGINRIASSLTNSGDHRVKDLIHWNPQRYVNVYTVSNAAGLAGHAVWPADADTIPEWDGIVMGHNYMGRIGTSDQTRSVVFAHELGHYLNLHHIWGGNNVPEFYYLPVGQQTNCGEDDQVADTPNTIGWSSCNLNASSCGNVRDNVQNAMDYSYCNVMFTEGQKARMRACLNSPVAGRNNIWTTVNLIATGVMEEPSLCAADFDADNTFICNPNGEEISFSNTSFHGAIDSVNWSFPGGVPTTSTEEMPTINYTQIGSFDASLTAYQNGQSQTITKQNYITVVSDSAWSFPFMEWFGANTALDGSRWFGRSLQPSQNWELTDQAYYSANHSLMMNNWESPLLTVNELYSPPFDLSNTNSTRLAFKFAYTGVETPSNSTKLQLQVSNNCETNWSTRLTLAGSNLLSAPIQNNPFIPSIDKWIQESINLPSAYLVDGFRFRFVFTSEGNDRLFIDDVNVDVTAGVANNYNQLQKLAVFPNPASTELNLTFELVEPLDVEISVLDILGQTVAKIPTQEFNTGLNSKSLSLKGFSPGTYVVKFVSNNGQMVKRFIII